MFDNKGVVGPAAITTAELRVLVDRLAGLEIRVSDAERVEQLGLLEQVKNAASAVQARLAVAFDASQREEQARAGMPASRRGRGVAEQVALARRESPYKGSRLLGLAKLLAADLPRTLDAMTAGLVSEWRATLVAQAAVVLEPADRRHLHAALAPRLAPAAPAGRAPGPALPHPVVRRPDPRGRPCCRALRRRAYHRRQRPGTVPGLQPGAGRAGLDGPMGHRRWPAIPLTRGHHDDAHGRDSPFGTAASSAWLATSSP